MLDSSGLAAFIDEHFTSTLFRLEQEPSYATGVGTQLERYLAGEPDPNLAAKTDWLKVIRGEVERGLHTYRVHVVREPLSDYKRCYLEWGLLPNAEAGEHIRVLDLTARPRPAALIDEDFWLIEETHAARLHYDDGRLQGAEVVADDGLARYRAARTAAWEAATPLAEWWQDHPQYWRERRAA